MCHVSEFLVANRPFTPPTPGFAEPAEANLAQWYGLGGGRDIRFWGVRLLGCGTRYQVIPKEAPKMADLRGARLYRVIECYSI